MTCTCCNVWPIFYVVFFQLRDVWVFLVCTVMGFKSRLWLGHSITLFPLFEPILNAFASVRWIIIFLKGSLSLYILDSWPYIMFKYSLISCRFYNWNNECKLFSPWGLDISTTELHSWYEMPFQKSCCWSEPNMSAVIVAKQLHLSKAHYSKIPGLLLYAHLMQNL